MSLQNPSTPDDLLTSKAYRQKPQSRTQNPKISCALSPQQEAETATETQAK